MVVAKTDRAHRGLAAQFADHGRDRAAGARLHALVWGVPEPAERHHRRAARPLTRNRQKMEVDAQRRPRGDHPLRVDERFGAEGKPPVAALVDCRLETGRTHQIRVHLAASAIRWSATAPTAPASPPRPTRLPEPARSLAAAFPRQALHAWLLGFRAPGDRRGNALREPASAPTWPMLARGA